MRGESQRCSRVGHVWFSLTKTCRRCIVCGIHQRLSFYWLRRDEQGEGWSLATKEECCAD